MSSYESPHSCKDLNEEVARLTEDITEVTIPYFLGDNIDALKQCPNIEKLGIAVAQSEDRKDNPALDISAILELKKLKDLRIYNCHITDYTVLEKLTQLESLSLDGLKISSLDFLKDYKELTSLDIGYSKIIDIANILHLKYLNYLRLAGNKISDIANIAQLEGLENLDLSYNKISSIEPLSGLTNLKYLFLSNNNIADFSPLYNLTKNIEELELEDNESTAFHKIPYVDEIEDTDFDLDDYEEDEE